MANLARSTDLTSPACWNEFILNSASLSPSTKLNEPSHSFDLHFLYVAFLVTDFVEELSRFTTTHVCGSVGSRYSAWTASSASSPGNKLGN
jgi:hypothetical protein